MDLETARSVSADEGTAKFLRYLAYLYLFPGVPAIYFLGGVWWAIALVAVAVLAYVTAHYCMAVTVLQDELEGGSTNDATQDSNVRSSGGIGQDR